jgi:hypothetical protein
MQVVGEGPPEALLDLAAASAGAGLWGRTEKALDRLRRMGGAPRDKLDLLARACLPASRQAAEAQKR